MTARKAADWGTPEERSVAQDGALPVLSGASFETPLAAAPQDEGCETDCVNRWIRSGLAPSDGTLCRHHRACPGD
ncbi:MAG: hypothetical protein ACJ8D1_09050, partial [Microvirga sp.]